MKKMLFLSVFVLLAFCVKAQTLPQKLQQAYQKFITDNQLSYASVSFSVLDAQTGNIIFGKQEKTGLAPASTLKTITSATAFSILGEDYTFKTEILSNGTVTNGILNGDLIIKGYGDPTLGSDRWANTNKQNVLNKILFALQQKGITSINGNIIADDSNWDTQSLPQGWIWQDIGNYYGASTSALCWGENFFELSFNPGKTNGSAVSIKNQENVYPFLKINNELTTGAYGSGDQVYAYSAPYTNTIYLRGTYGIDLKKDIGLALPDPALAMAFDLFNFLQKNNVQSLNYQTSRNHPIKTSSTTAVLTTIKSPPLKEIVYWLNQKSINLYGEQLLRSIGEKTGKSAAVVDGVKAVQKFWDAKDIDAKSLNIVDGSGLAPQDRVTSLSMAKVLFYAKKQPWFNSYLESLPIHNDMKMKSGTIADVLAYAGYSNPKGGNPVCFTLIINNYNGSISTIRQKMYNLLNQLK